MKPVKKNRTLAKAVLAVCVAVVLIGPAKTQQKGALRAEPKGDWHDTSWGKSFQPRAGVVPDAKTAIVIAEAVLLPIYGEKTIDGERPLRASLKDGVWTVEGTLPKGLVMAGGTAVVRLSKDDGRVLFITHYQ
jgi:hypothetical protein